MVGTLLFVQRAMQEICRILEPEFNLAVPGAGLLQAAGYSVIQELLDQE